MQVSLHIYRIHIHYIYTQKYSLYVDIEEKQRRERERERERGKKEDIEGVTKTIPAPYCCSLSSLCTRDPVKEKTEAQASQNSFASAPNW